MGMISIEKIEDKEGQGSQQDLIFFKIIGISMRPFFKTGDRLIVKKTSVQDLKIGDIISYYSNQYEKGICHRLIKKVSCKDKYLLYMRGDACLNLDEPVDEKALLGKVIAVIKNNRIITLIGWKQQCINWLILLASPFISIGIKIGKVVFNNNE